MRSERLVHLALVGATAASTATLAWDGAFPPAGSGFNDVLAEGRGWSAVTLFLAVPLGLVALNAARRGSVRARVAVGGVMAYLFYTYLEMAVSPPFTALYLVYVGTFAAASWAGVATLAGLEDRAVEEAFAGAPRRVVGAFGIAFAVLLSAAWLKGIVADTVAGRFGYPQGAQAVGHVVHALDLGLMVPLGLGSGLLLLRRDPVAWRIAGVMVVVAGCMAPALAAMVGTSLWTQGQSLVGVLPFALLAAWSLGLLAVVFVGPRLATPLSTRVDARTVGRRSTWHGACFSRREGVTVERRDLLKLAGMAPFVPAIPWSPDSELSCAAVEDLDRQLDEGLADVREQFPGGSERADAVRELHEALFVYSAVQELPIEVQVHPTLQRRVRAAASQLVAAHGSLVDHLHGLAVDPVGRLDRDELGEVLDQADGHARRLGVGFGGRRRWQGLLHLATLDVRHRGGEVVLQDYAAASADALHPTRTPAAADAALEARVHQAREDWVARGVDPAAFDATPLTAQEHPGLFAFGALMTGLGVVILGVGVAAFDPDCPCPAIALWLLGGLFVLVGLISIGVAHHHRADAPPKTAPGPGWSNPAPAASLQLWHVHVQAAGDWARLPELSLDPAHHYAVRVSGTTTWGDHALGPAGDPRELAGDDAALPGAPVGTLLGRVGGQVFAIGAEPRLPEGLSGALELVVNGPSGGRASATGALLVLVDELP